MSIWTGICGLGGMNEMLFSGKMPESGFNGLKDLHDI
jgi:hypothetical protein